MRRLLTLTIAFCVFLVGSGALAQTEKNDASQCAIQRKSLEGWERYYLTGTDADAICVYLPKKPERFAGGKLRGGDTPVTADVYLAGGNDEIYAVIFMYDLPKKTEDMPDAQKAEIFFGTWRGTVEHNRQVLEKMGRPAEIQYAEQRKLTVMGHEARVQLFKIGTDLGQARVVFVGKKAYMLMGVWPPDRAEKRSSAFFDGFEMRVRQSSSAAPPNNSLDRSGGSVVRSKPVAAKDPRVRAARSTQTLCG